MHFQSCFRAISGHILARVFHVATVHSVGALLEQFQSSSIALPDETFFLIFFMSAQLNSTVHFQSSFRAVLVHFRILTLPCKASRAVLEHTPKLIPVWFAYNSSAYHWFAYGDRNNEQPLGYTTLRDRSRAESFD